MTRYELRHMRQMPNTTKQWKFVVARYPLEAEDDDTALDKVADVDVADWQDTDHLLLWREDGELMAYLPIYLSKHP